MHETIPLLSQTVILFGTAVFVAWAFRMLRAPSILGFLLTGLVIGPSALHFIEAEQVEQFAELGIILLLFNIGLELSPRPLLEMGRRLVTATVLQVLGTMAAAALVLLVLSPAPLGGVIIIGIGVALSSTAIVLKILTDRNEIRSAAGNLCTGILLLQDVFVILVMMALPLFAAGTGENGHGEGSPLIRSAIGLVALIVITITARRFLPGLLHQVIRQGGKELMVLFAVLMACGGAWSASLFGWPLALGACVAGLLLAESDLSHQLVAEITPFRDVFNALFFISLGMSVSLVSAAAYWHVLLIAILATLFLKAVIVAAAMLVAGWPLRLGLHVGLAMSTVSEFSYVLGREAYRFELLPAGTLDQLVSYAVGTMMIGSVLVPIAGPLSRKLANRLRPEADHAAPEVLHDHELEGHVIVIGYGLNGENLGRVLKSTQVPFCVVEMNPALVAKARAAGAPVVVGDGTRTSILEHAGLLAARALVVAMNDPEATRRIVSQVRAQRPDLYIVARSYYIGELDALYKLGANVVISADFEASIEIFSHVLRELGVPDNVVEAQVTSVRAGGYGVLRGLPAGRAEHIREVLRLLQTTATQTFYLSVTSPACNKSIAQLDVRANSGVTIIAVVREGKPQTNPPADLELHAGDVLVLVGSHAQLDAARKLLDVQG